MSNSSSSPMMQDLFAAARDDAPSGAVRDAVWGRVAASTVPVAGGAAAAKLASATAATPVKLLAVGAAIGAASVVLGVLALTTTDITTTGGTTAAPHRTPAVLMTGAAAGAQLADPAPRGRAQMHQMQPDPIMELAATPSPATIPVKDEASALAEEARLVTEARGALVRGEPERALALVRSTRKLPARVLEPEELVLEARTLRALGRTDEALATELTLKRRFPDHALSR